MNPRHALPGLAAALVVCAAGTAIAAPLRMRVDRTDGWPRDSIERAAFTAAFDSALAAPGPGALPVVRDETSHRDSVWHLEVVVALPPELPQRRIRPVPNPRRGRPKVEVLLAERGQRASRGLVVIVAIRSPEASASDRPAIPVRTEVAFPGRTHDAYPFAEAGVCTARLALEALQLAARPGVAAQVDLTPAIRVTAVR